MAIYKKTELLERVRDLFDKNTAKDLGDLELQDEQADELSQETRDLLRHLDEKRAVYEQLGNYDSVLELAGTLAVLVNYRE